MNTLNQSQSILANLPPSFVAEVKQTLGAFSEAYITYNKETGEYDHSCCIALSGNPNRSIEHLGTVLSHEVLTEAEQIVSYVKNFKSFPYNAGSEGGKPFTYTGKKDWQALNSNWTNVTMDNDGNLQFINA